MTTKRRVAQRAEQQLARDRIAAPHDARALALELSHRQPRGHFDPMAAGVVLRPDETVYRRVPAWLAVLDHGRWATPSWASALVTDERILCRFSAGHWAFLPWRGLVGLHIVLAAEHITFDFGDGQPVTLSEPTAPLTAVASVAWVYGIRALLHIPELGARAEPRL